MIVFWGLFSLGLVLFYFVWSILISVWSRLNELGVKNEKSSTTFFDNVLYITIAGSILARAMWMVFHRVLYYGIPWGILPYSRSASGYLWLTVFPWRFFRLTDGIYYPVLWAFIGVVLLFTVFWPTFELARRLRLEKRGIMRAFLIRITACAAVSTLYFGALTYFSL
ncbi:hypothetical protein CO112_01215 [Candidatus Dojkabacteria bacterium CG_4_9_14_3_um_filter_150_Dojkabacteria_WS6_41_13]|uniref:Uncharacterized protein n=1 Tax=Candidatus Dojkabacteria bacterium CG_4_10_14_0_2_um_filter_Dojkabacteria_WS6_41_15 TaxID=2014249 RepID=A0A2M7W2F0_9BACT|nr:MAG: hypothetical protein COZ14_02430 [Candidatus Dojkabacteria bacterium CG_4_10_14_3_um_filter_Dojkabacteria_WS6_41_9]PJA13594.1 MAG: hypothetical protein COX64_03240 [Candidatus Dojkabacteria bacterium CG_4_10_14_0_2_um_filter_Dojkabacteria_WS6_41_15]PJB23290.1 MAG: hypothetical protein CO112_01215 [Candidatus Dojkabacteria bacterium CG_4_9_14_3_um_filter_150_Dojkabacteria_WS6_41_13]